MTTSMFESSSFSVAEGKDKKTPIVIVPTRPKGG
jgi:hypothetical protein